MVHLSKQQQRANNGEESYPAQNQKEFTKTGDMKAHHQARKMKLEDKKRQKKERKLMRNKWLEKSTDKKNKTKENNYSFNSNNSLPPIEEKIVQNLRESKYNFAINTECTSLTLSPSGRTLVAGFTDGTIRIFDLTGRLWDNSQSVKQSSGSFDFDDDCSSSSDEELFSSKRKPSKNEFVSSKKNQQYGAVAAQVIAKGVTTSLLIHISISEDCRFAFAGVHRGSTEMVAIDLKEIEHHHDMNKRGDILDLISVWKHNDAKLRGFGACIKRKNGEYLLFCGKGIKVRVLYDLLLLI